MNVTLSGLVLVALGGALGGVARLALSNLLGRWCGTRFPWGTLLVNLSGALLAGLLAGWLGIPSSAELSLGWLALVVGVLGGYTTVSSFSLQALNLSQNGHGRQALVYVAATVLLGLPLTSLGWWLAGGQS